MGLIRGLTRGIAGLVALGLGILILVPVAFVLTAVSIPVLIVLALAGVIGTGALLSIGLRTIFAVVIGVIALAAAVAILGVAIPLGILLLKAMLFGLLLLWLARRVFGWRHAVPREKQLVGLPVVDVAAPRRDKYDIAAERELEEELGI
jgi:hypothetical protein